MNATKNNIGNNSTTRRKKQKQLHRQLREYAEWMHQMKDSSEVQKDQRKSVPISQLPMLF